MAGNPLAWRGVTDGVATLQEYSLSEANALANVILSTLAANTLAKGTLVLSTSNSFTSATFVGAVGDLYRQEDGSTTFQESYLFQRDPGGSSLTNANIFATVYDTSSPVVTASLANVYNFGNIALGVLVNDGPFSYRLSNTNPSITYGGTWQERITLTDYYNDQLEGESTYIWQRTDNGDSSVFVTSNRIVKIEGRDTYHNNVIDPGSYPTTGSIKLFSDQEIADLDQWIMEMMNATGVGRYVLQESAPTTGTWIACGQYVDRVSPYALEYTSPTDGYVNQSVPYISNETLIETYSGFSSEFAFPTYSIQDPDFIGEFAGDSFSAAYVLDLSFISPGYSTLEYAASYISTYIATEYSDGPVYTLGTETNYLGAQGINYSRTFVTGSLEYVTDYQGANYTGLGYVGTGTFGAPSYTGAFAGFVDTFALEYEGPTFDSELYTQGEPFTSTFIDDVTGPSYAGEPSYEATYIAPLNYTTEYLQENYTGAVAGYEGLTFAIYTGSTQFGDVYAGTYGNTFDYTSTTVLYGTLDPGYTSTFSGYVGPTYTGPSSAFAGDNLNTFGGDVSDFSGYIGEQTFAGEASYVADFSTHLYTGYLAEFTSPYDYVRNIPYHEGVYAGIILYAAPSYVGQKQSEIYTEEVFYDGYQTVLEFASGGTESYVPANIFPIEADFVSNTFTGDASFSPIYTPDLYSVTFTGPANYIGVQNFGGFSTPFAADYTADLNYLGPLSFSTPYLGQVTYMGVDFIGGEQGYGNYSDFLRSFGTQYIVESETQTFTENYLGGGDYTRTVTNTGDNYLGGTTDYMADAIQIFSAEGFSTTYGRDRTNNTYSDYVTQYWGSSFIDGLGAFTSSNIVEYGLEFTSPLYQGAAYMGQPSQEEGFNSTFNPNYITDYLGFGSALYIGPGFVGTYTGTYILDYLAFNDATVTDIYFGPDSADFTSFGTDYLGSIYINAYTPSLDDFAGFVGSYDDYIGTDFPHYSNDTETVDYVGAEYLSGEGIAYNDGDTDFLSIGVLYASDYTSIVTYNSSLTFLQALANDYLHVPSYTTLAYLEIEYIRTSYLGAGELSYDTDYIVELVPAFSSEFTETNFGAEYLGLNGPYVVEYFGPGGTYTPVYTSDQESNYQSATFTGLVETDYIGLAQYTAFPLYVGVEYVGPSVSFFYPEAFLPSYTGPVTYGTANYLDEDGDYVLTSSYGDNLYTGVGTFTSPSYTRDVATYTHESEDLYVPADTSYASVMAFTSGSNDYFSFISYISPTAGYTGPAGESFGIGYITDGYGNTYNVSYTDENGGAFQSPAANYTGLPVYAINYMPVGSYAGVTDTELLTYSTNEFGGFAPGFSDAYTREINYLSGTAYQGPDPSYVGPGDINYLSTTVDYSTYIGASNFLSGVYSTGEIDYTTEYSQNILTYSASDNNVYGAEFGNAETAYTQTNFGLSPQGNTDFALIYDGYVLTNYTGGTTVYLGTGVDYVSDQSYGMETYSAPVSYLGAASYDSVSFGGALYTVSYLSDTALQSFVSTYDGFVTQNQIFSSVEYNPDTSFLPSYLGPVDFTPQIAYNSNDIIVGNNLYTGEALFVAAYAGTTTFGGIYASDENFADAYVGSVTYILEPAVFTTKTLWRRVA